MLTRRERRVLRRLEAGKTPGSVFVVRFLVRKGFATRHGDGSVVSTRAGRTALSAAQPSSKRTMP